MIERLPASNAEENYTEPADFCFSSDLFPVRSCRAYPYETTLIIENLIGRFTENQRAVPVSFRSLVPWMKVGERATHYIHPYPAKLLPHIAHFFLSSDLLCPPAGVVLDPFGGSGTVALEACLSGRTAAYVDTNPLARLIARAKIWPGHGADLDSALRNVSSRFRRTRVTTAPKVVNLKKWFDPQIIRDLARLRAAVDAEPDYEIRVFLQVAFSATVRKVSNADLRLSVPVLKKNKEELPLNSVWRLFEEQFSANVKRTSEYRQMVTECPQFLIGGYDARLMTKEKGGLMSDSSVDLVITSPPYAGAQKYIRASSLCLGWLNLAGEGQLKPLENQTIGREHLTRAQIDKQLRTAIPAANCVLERIERINPARAAICATYLNEMQEVMQQIARVVKPNGFIVLVIGNNLVCGEDFRSSDYLCEQLENLGFRLRIKMVDEIKSRGLMTKRNKTASMITREWVLVMQKSGAV